MKLTHFVLVASLLFAASARGQVVVINNAFSLGQSLPDRIGVGLLATTDIFGDPSVGRQFLLNGTTIVGGAGLSVSGEGLLTSRGLGLMSLDYRKNRELLGRLPCLSGVLDLT
jgi:hypothetical protein